MRTPSGLDGSRIAYYVIGITGITDYLYAFLSTRTFIAAITGHDQSLGVQHVSPGQVEGVMMPLPRTTTQRGVSASLEARTKDADSLQKRLEARSETISKLPAALLQKAFSGEV